jgi:hypothetical protein
MAAVDANAHSEYVQVIKYDFKPGLIETSIHHWSLQGI